MPPLLTSRTATALLDQGATLMIPAKNSNTCPGGSSYAGAGYSKVRQ